MILDRKTDYYASLSQIHGTAAYISPEQTGKVNIPIDFRSDIYSLGVVFYELLTGQLPFQKTEPLELIYDHIVKIPAPPKEVAIVLIPSKSLFVP